jgi:hypothetical protein
MRLEHVFEGVHEILEQVKPIGDLSGFWRPVASPIGIGFRPIAGNNLHARMRSEPLGQGLGLTIGQQSDRLPAFHVNQHGAVGLACTEREIVHAQYLRRAVAREW